MTTTSHDLSIILQALSRAARKNKLTELRLTWKEGGLATLTVSPHLLLDTITVEILSDPENA